MHTFSVIKLIKRFISRRFDEDEDDEAGDILIHKVWLGSFSSSEGSK